MKKFFVYFALFIAALFIVSCGESEDDGEGAVCTTPGAFRCSGDYSQTCDQEAWKNFEQCTADKPCNATTGKCENGSSGSNGGTDNGAGIHLGIIGFNYKLTEMGIRLLSNASDFTSFIDSLNRENNTALYYADDMALERMKEYNKPPKLEHVALVTFTDGIDNQSIAPELKPEYDTPDAYLDDLSKKIHNEKIHGLSVESYTIGLRTADEISELKPKFDAMLNKLASSDSYAFPVDDMNEVKKHFADIANSLVQVSRSINYGVYMPSGYPSGKIRYTFDNAQSADSSELYIEANYNKDTTTLESVTYHGFKTGATTIKAQQGIKGTLLYRFDDLKYSDGSSVSEDMSFTLWQQIDGKWKSETEITPADYPPEVTKDMSSALIVLVLDCTTSLSEENFRIMKDAAKDFVRTLANASGNGGGNNTDPTEPTTDPTNQDNGAKEACTSIYECYAQCQDSACAQACLDNGTPEGQQTFMNMYNCWNNQGCFNATTNDEFSDCVVNNCYNETDACGLLGGGGEAADNSYKAPYGSLKLNFSVQAIANDTDDQNSTNGLTQAAFATGTYGNGSTSVTPADAYMIQSSAGYYNQTQNGKTYTGVQVMQVPVYNNNGQGAGGNPVVILDIPEESAAVGSLNTSLFQGGEAQLYVVDINWNTQQISCFHAFGEGTTNITSIGDIANHGDITLSGNVTLYSTKNYNGAGDISSQIGVNVCAPQY